MAVSVIVAGQRLRGFGMLGQMVDFICPSDRNDWLPEAQHRARCMALHMSAEDRRCREAARAGDRQADIDALRDPVRTVSDPAPP